jgi:acyl-CoA reductase-like NAD-dependent aldehyde dehydrogenase
LDTEAVKVINGAIPETTELLKQQFDYILYTGSPAVGKIVMKAASEHLTPVTLELGGKSPCIIDKDVNLDVAAKRITWGKFLNLGQTCVAPDYMFVHKDVKKDFLKKVQENLNSFYGSDPKSSPDYSRIVSERHTERLGSLLEGQNVVIGGAVDVKQRYVAPTIVDEPDVNSKLMQEEIFGPILPVMSYDNFDEVVKFINQRPKPLALYLFSTNSKLHNKVVEKTSSGATVINDVVVHNVIDTLPFGGVGNSGMGSYNGEFTFKTFSHDKPVLIKPTWVDPFARYPPYDNTKISVVSIGLNYSLNGLKTIAKYTVPVVIGGLTYLVLSSRL